MVSIPVFEGASKSDPEKFVRQFKRACMTKGDRTEVAWLSLLLIHSEDEAAWWYESKTNGTKRSLDSLTRALCREF